MCLFPLTPVFLGFCCPQCCLFFGQQGKNKTTYRHIHPTITPQTDNLKIKTKKAVERLEGVAKKTTGGALAKGQLPNQKAKRIQTSAKRKCTIK